jgi:hypothetical protein
MLCRISLACCQHCRHNHSVKFHVGISASDSLASLITLIFLLCFLVFAQQQTYWPYLISAYRSRQTLCNIICFSQTRHFLIQSFFLFRPIDSINLLTDWIELIGYIDKWFVTRDHDLNHGLLFVIIFPDIVRNLSFKDTQIG